MTCQCGHGFDHHFGIVAMMPHVNDWPTGPPITSSRCMQCDCTERVERPEQADIFGTEAS